MVLWSEYRVTFLGPAARLWLADNDIMTDECAEKSSEVILTCTCSGQHYTTDLKHQTLTPALPKLLPVNDSMAVQEHQSWRDLGGVKAGPRLVELPRALNLKHQVTSVHILHHEEQPVLWRKQELGSAWEEHCFTSKRPYPPPPPSKIQKYRIFTYPGFNILWCCFFYQTHFEEPLKRSIMGILYLWVSFLF